MHTYHSYETYDYKRQENYVSPISMHIIYSYSQLSNNNLSGNEFNYRNGTQWDSLR